MSHRAKVEMPSTWASRGMTCTILCTTSTWCSWRGRTWPSWTVPTRTPHQPPAARYLNAFLLRRFQGFRTVLSSRQDLCSLMWLLRVKVTLEWTVAGQMAERTFRRQTFHWRTFGLTSNNRPPLTPLSSTINLFSSSQPPLWLGWTFDLLHSRSVVFGFVVSEYVLEESGRYVCVCVCISRWGMMCAHGEWVLYMTALSGVEWFGCALRQGAPHLQPSWWATLTLDITSTSPRLSTASTQYSWPPRMWTPYTAPTSVSPSPTWCRVPAFTTASWCGAGGGSSGEEVADTQKGVSAGILYSTSFCELYAARVFLDLVAVLPSLALTFSMFFTFLFLIYAFRRTLDSTLCDVSMFPGVEETVVQMDTLRLPGGGA